MRNHPDHVLSLVDDPASSSTKEPTYTPGDPDPHAQQSLDGKDGNRKIQIADINWRCFDHARKRLEDDIRRYIDQYRKREEEYRTLDRRVNKIITQVGNGDEKRNVQSIFPSKQPKYCYAKSAVCIIATKGECWHSRCHGLPIYGEISPFPPDSSTFRSLRTGKDPRPFQLQGPRCHDLPIFSSSPQGYNATELPKNEAPTQSYSDISTSYGFTHTFSDGKFQEFKVCNILLLDRSKSQRKLTLYCSHRAREKRYMSGNA